MTYKIAVGSSDGVNVDLKFGEIEKFIIFTVEEKLCKLSGIRQVETSVVSVGSTKNDCGQSTCASGRCSGNGCQGSFDIVNKVDLISDCRCIICKKVGFQAQKQLERKAISIFDIEGNLKEILEKIIAYYGKIDRHRKKVTM